MMNYLTNCLPKTSKAVGTSLLLPLHHVVLLPGITIPVIVRKANNIGVAEATLLSPQKQLVITTVRPDVSENVDIQSLEEIYPIATLAVLQRIIRLPTGMELVVQGLKRVCIEQLRIVDQICEVKFSQLPEIASSATIIALTAAIQSLWGKTAILTANFPQEILTVLLNTDDPALLAYQSLMLLPHDVAKLQAVLEEENLEELLRQTLTDLSQELEVQRLQSEVLGQTKKELEKTTTRVLFARAVKENSRVVRGKRTRKQRN
ncbi:MAG: LON peptidase substrate-binding domain-containing protein [Cyanomargarita calcarea GSE-NOS-MK-12-04C]|jgi:ATP-dependent Lon protease|uniref:LON peptidase substrate-binding domain-containing protein n=1 Tax=Cyanomargarita calcarea GSE-NOS-MK-12-04C TaxID=2839659 RepID=A0A951UWK0_9CYAN|nr:LON peptidase substrate-binding domain-containing protein [Cyanomargarita calcarea GSE-NOS-MK-12-04C]